MNLLLRLIWNSHTRSVILFLLRFFPVSRGKVVFVSWGGDKYACSPKAIAEYITENNINSGFSLWFALLNHESYREIVPNGINTMEMYSLKYYYHLATAQFVVANIRISGGLMWPFPKKEGQYYIQTMHGGHGLKRQELELCDEHWHDVVKLDSSRIDLMLSDSTFWTRLARTVFGYENGEILEKGLPRNDVFFSDDDNDDCNKYLVYVPTFRDNGIKDVYGFNVDNLIASLEKRFGGNWYVKISAHPNMLGYYKELYDFSHPRVIDIAHDDLQQHLVESDAAITDYSSAGFEFALTKKPVFLLARDWREYERGLYFKFEELPFPFAENAEQLCRNIESFDNNKYIERLDKFNNEVIGLKETGYASEAVVEWMLRKMR